MEIGKWYQFSQLTQQTAIVMNKHPHQLIMVRCDDGKVFRYDEDYSSIVVDVLLLPRPRKLEKNNPTY